MSSIVVCKFCRNKMPEANLQNHIDRKHSLECLYCDCDVKPSSMENHIAEKHKAINQELQEIRKESFENGKREGKRECLEELYANCTVCKVKMLKNTMDAHRAKVHPPIRPIVIPFVQDTVIPLPLKRSLYGLYQRERSADVFFVFKDQHRLAAHKCILASDSAVFFRMFYGELKETGDVKIADASSDGFRVFLQSFYLCAMAITEENVAEIMYLGNKYDARKCTKACQDFLKFILCTETVLNVLKLSIRYSCEALRELCVIEILQSGRSIIQTDNFYHSNRDVLKELLSINFQGRNELTLFEACMEWAKLSCQKENIDASDVTQLRLQLGDFFDYIRLDRMSPLQFVQFNSSFAGILTKDELRKISKAIATQSVDRPNTSSCLIPDVVNCAPKYSFTRIQNAFAEIEKLFENEETADVFFVFEMGDEKPKRIPAHKCILAHSSTKFDELFYGSGEDNRDIHVLQSCTDEFLVFLQSFYWKDMPLTMDNVTQVMFLADKYDARICFFDCESFLKSHLSVENIFLVFELAYLYRRAELYESCVRIIEKKYRSLLETNDFLNCSRDTVKYIVMIDFEARNSFVIFDACMKWAKYSCETSNMNASAENLVEKLGDIFGKIRFTSMTSTEFIKCQIDYGAVFNTDRLKDILKGIGGSK